MTRPTAETISRDRQIDRIHFARMWPRRHDAAHTRASLRDNVRAQRAAVAHERTGRPVLVYVYRGTAEAIT